MNVTFRSIRAASALLCVAIVAGCNLPKTPQGPGSVYDPYETVNRGTHSFNRAMDQALFRPASKGYVSIVPDPMVTSFSQFADTISEPGNMINGLLQGNPKRAGIAVARFVVNMTIGFAGLADPATEFGIYSDETDFGETLYTWGFQEGAYIELPVLGPSNERDAVGTFVDFFTNPISFATHNPLDNVGVYSEIVQRMGDRGRYSDTIDSILYESADSYAQARVIYLQNRRFELAGSGNEVYSDPYEDDSSGDPYAGGTSAIADPYEDPYAE